MWWFRNRRKLRQETPPNLSDVQRAAAEVAVLNEPYRLRQRPNGTWNAERQYVSYLPMFGPYAQWDVIADGLDSEDAALRAIRLYLHPVKKPVDAEGKLIREGQSNG